MARLPAAALAVGLVLAGCSDGEAADYDAEFRTELIDACTAAFGGEGAPQVCGCWHDALQQNVAFEDLPSIDDLTADDFDVAPTRVPGSEMEVPLDLLASCVRAVGAEATIGEPVPLPTTPRPPTTPTTATTVLG